MQLVLYEWRKLPKQHGYPAQLMFGRSLQLLLPQPACAFSPIDMLEAAAAMDKKFDAAAVHYDRDKVNLSALQLGQSVLVQREKSKKWDWCGEIIEVRPDGLSNLVNLEGKVIIRGRAMLKPVFNGHGGGQVQVQDQNRGQGKQQEGELSPSSVSAPSESLRRSERLREKEEAKWSSSHVPAQTVRAMPQNCESSSGCRECLRTQKTLSTSPLGVSPSITSSGRLLPQGRQPSLSVPSCSSPVLSVAGYGPRISAGPRGVMPSSGRPEPVPDQDARFPWPKFPFPQSSALQDRWLRTPTGWNSVPEAYQLPESSQYGPRQLPYPQLPPVVYYGGHQPFSQCGFPGCGRDPGVPGTPTILGPCPAGIPRTPFHRG